MEVSLNWIKKYVDLTGSTGDRPDDDRQALSLALTSLGLEVEGMKIAGDLAGVVSAEVLECVRHPEADKLSVCKVSDGTETYPVVCGAPNVAAGQKVLLAKVGAELPGAGPGDPPLKIKKARLRGQESHGMICAGDEVGLGGSHEGIMVLDPSVPAGLPMDRIPGLSDTLFSLNVTPNRPDALCHVGVAREVAAKYGKPLRYPAPVLRESGPAASGAVEVALEDLIGCTYYAGRVIRGVQVGPSPDWLVKALESIGKRSINNVVDLTNYVLMEIGQPTHAFDLGKIRGGKVIIRNGRDGEKLRILDGSVRDITPDDLVIADAAGPMALAGVMGGKDSEVDAATTDIFLETAYFNPSVIRRQGRRHGLSSDSSHRFERGVDPLNTAWACDYLAGLIAEWCGGAVAEGRVEKSSPEHPSSRRVVYIRPTRAEKLLGMEIGASECTRRLEAIGLERGETGHTHGEEALAFHIPGFRGDLEREADLIEEVARLGDYNAIPVILPSLPLSYKALPPQESLARTLKHFLRDAGLNETLNLRFSSRKTLAKLGLPPEDPRSAFVPLRNPLSEEWEILPTTSLPSLLQAAAYNQKNQERDCRFFEVGKSFYHRPQERTDRLPGVWEEETLYLVLAGEWPDRRPWSVDASLSAPVEFHHLTGLLENLLAAAGAKAVFSHPGGEPYLHPVESGAIIADLAPSAAGAEILRGSKRPPGPLKAARIGSFGVLHPRTQNAFDLKGPILAAEISLSGLLAAVPAAKKFAPFGQFSSTSRDLNLVVDLTRSHGEIFTKMPVSRISNLREVRLNSVYRGQGVPDGKKALHYSFIYRHDGRTLTDEEVNKAQEKLNLELGKDAGILFK